MAGYRMGGQFLRGSGFQYVLCGRVWETPFCLQPQYLLLREFLFPSTQLQEKPPCSAVPLTLGAHPRQAGRSVCYLGTLDLRLRDREARSQVIALGFICKHGSY